MVIIFWDFLTFDQIFFSPQVKRSGIITNDVIVPQELQNDLWLRILGN